MTLLLKHLVLAGFKVHWSGRGFRKGFTVVPQFPDIRILKHQKVCFDNLDDMICDCFKIQTIFSLDFEACEGMFLDPDTQYPDYFKIRTFLSGF